MTVPGPYEIELVTSIDAFDQLAPEWPESSLRRFGPLTSHEWFSSAARVFCAPDSLHVIVCRRQGRLVGVAPLCRARHRGLEWLELIGVGALFEPAAVTAIDPQALSALCVAMLGQGRPLFLQRLDTEDPCIDLLERSARSQGRIRRLIKPGTLFLPPGLTSGQMSAGMPARRRRKLLGMRDMLSAQGVLTIEAFAPDPHELEHIFAAVMKVESAGWKGRAGTALLVNDRLRSFFGDLALRFARRGELRVFLLRLDGTPIAAQLGIAQDGRYWALKRGFDEAWRQYSPGILLTCEAISHVLDQCHAGYEFLGLPEQWQRQWGPQERALCAVAYYPGNLPGLVAYATDALIGAVRGVVERTRRSPKA